MSPEQLTEIMERNGHHFEKLDAYEAVGTALAPVVRDLRTLSIELFRLQTELMSLRGDMLYNKAHEPHVYAFRIEQMLKPSDKIDLFAEMQKRAAATLQAEIFKAHEIAKDLGVNVYVVHDSYRVTGPDEKVKEFYRRLNER